MFNNRANQSKQNLSLSLHHKAQNHSRARITFFSLSTKNLPGFSRHMNLPRCRACVTTQQASLCAKHTCAAVFSIQERKIKIE